ncbi:MAG: hypothetical protein HN368_15685 [Spirochaetales bacterium]|jgi:hypothetical protein|nr:hypothetical protein [Spirochaetales bacterium]
MRIGHNRLFVRVFCLSARELWRNRFGLVLLIVIPILFLAVAAFTTSTTSIPIKLFFAEKVESIFLTQRAITLVFMSAAVSGFLSAYYSVMLFHRNLVYFRYCTVAGMPPAVFTAARFTFFLMVVTFLAVLITSIVSVSIPVNRPLLAFLGFLILGAIYGAFGGAVGVLSKDFLIAVLLIVLLANLDAGWLQNPVYYTYAQDAKLIRLLPAFFPCQFIFSVVFSDRVNIRALILSLSYATGFLLALFVLVSLKLKGVLR